MSRNYLITAWRLFRRNKLYSTINLAGLSIGIAASLVILIFVRSEVSYDKYHRYSDRIYRISVDPFATAAPSFTYLLQSDYPQIEEIARIFRMGKGQIQLEDQVFAEDNIVFAEDNIFGIFDIDLLKGSLTNPLSQPNSVILSETLALKYFNSSNVTGKQILLNDEFLIQVAGVFRDQPYNTHFHMDMIVSYLTLKGIYGEGAEDYFWGSTNYTDNVTYTYFRVRKDAVINEMIASFPDFINRHLDDREDKTAGRPPSDFVKFDICKVSDIHLHSRKLGEVEVNGNIQYVRIFFIAGIFILLIACINFINLNTARAITRAKEIGLKKIIGATKMTLIRQFMMETLFFTVSASVLACLLVIAFEPNLNNTFELSYALNPVKNVQDVLMILGIIAGTTLLAGIYPAIYLSAYQPVSIIKNVISRGKKGNLLRNSLVIFQFAISIGLIISVLIVFRQLNYIRKADVGFERENIILIPTTDEIFKGWPVIKSRLQKLPFVSASTLSKRTPGSELLDAPGFTITLDSQVVDGSFLMPHNRVDFDFFETYDIPIIAGRTFSREFSTDSMQAFIINEAALRELGLKNPDEAIGLPVTVPGGIKGNIIGVTRDFNYESLKKQIIPVITYIIPRQANTMAIRITPGQTDKKIKSIRELFYDLIPDYSFNYTFLDDRINALYQNESRMLAIFKYFSMITILIAMFGLFGLSVYNTETRIKEIGIRKVNGATLKNILELLVRQFFYWIAVAYLIILPVSYLLSKKWLESFAYKTNIPWWIFGLTFIGVILVAMLTVSYQTLKAARKNPVEVLKYE
jgi:putative ABC transport system permease protein